MDHSSDQNSLVRTLGSAALGVGIGLVVLGAGFYISRLTLAESTTVPASTSAPTAPLATPTPPRPTAPAPTATPVRTPAATATPVPTATKDPLVVTAYQGQGLRLAALTIPAGYTLTSPIAGKITVVLYQFVDGEIRTGTNIPDQPTFPYVFIRSADREIKLRPGALDKDVKLVVKDGDTVAAGAALFTTTSDGASSWRTFYDRSVTAQVIASVTAQPSGSDIDPVPVFK